MILKLVRAKEGGWILRTMRPAEGDVRSRSVYRCRHVPGSVPDTQEELTGALNEQRARNFQHATSRRHHNNHQSDGAQVSPEDGVFGKLVAPPRHPSNDNRAKVRLTMGSIGSPAHHGMQGPSGLADRALAPPFERSLTLESQLIPVLSPGGQMYHSQANIMTQTGPNNPDSWAPPPRSRPSGPNLYQSGPMQPPPPPGMPMQQMHAPQPSSHQMNQQGPPQMQQDNSRFVSRAPPSFQQMPSGSYLLRTVLADTLT